MSSTVDQILAGKYPAKAHAKRVADKLRSKGHDDAGIIYIEGQHTRMIEDDDGEQPFRLEFSLLLINSLDFVADCHVVIVSAATSSTFPVVRSRIRV